MPRSVKKTMFRSLAIIASIVVGLPLIGLGWVKASRIRGEYQAYRDVRKGHYIELGYGLPTPWRRDFVNLVHRRHPEAEFRSVAGCIVSPDLEEYVRGYNDYMERAATLHFGHDVFQEAMDDTRKAYEAKRETEVQD